MLRGSSVSICVLLLMVLPAIAASAPQTSAFTYVGGAYAEREAASVGGVCTSSREGDGDEWVEVPVVVGGVCAVPLGDATTVTIVVEDAAWGAARGGGTPFRYHFFGGSAPDVTCATGATAWGEATIVVPPGCTEVSVYLSELATTGTITVARS